MTDPALTGHIIAQRKALSTIPPTGPFELALAHLLMAAYKRRLRAIVEAAPAWTGEEVLSASQHLENRCPVQGISEN